jgi:hypothetical protein
VLAEIPALAVLLDVAGREFVGESRFLVSKGFNDFEVVAGFRLSPE